MCIYINTILSAVTGVFIERGNLKNGTYTEKNKTCEDEGRDQGNDSISQRMTSWLPNHQNLGKRHEQILPHSPQREPTLLRTLT